jgi:hypothetical protein
MSSSLLSNRAIAAVRLAYAAFAIFAFSAAAEAAVYISYVASNGNDANPCTVATAPCKTLARAYNVTSANGTIRVLTALQSNLTIAKNITISGDGAPIVGTMVISGASTNVTLQGLKLNGVGIIANGIRIDSAATVHIEDCTVERYTNAGIKLVALTVTELFVSNTVSRDNTDTGLYVFNGAARVAVDNSRFENNGGHGVYLEVAKANIVRSIASGNYVNGYQLGGSANITETTAADNGGAGFVFLSSASATLASSVARGNGTGISNAGAVSITESIITSNSAAISNGGTLYTRQNNVLGGPTFGPAAIPFAAY